MRRDGPSDGIRALAAKARRHNRERRIAALRTTVADLSRRVEGGLIRREDVTHAMIYRQANISAATYWRYLADDAELNASANALVGPLVTQPVPMADATRGGVTVEGEVRRLKTELAQLLPVLDNLKRQVAVCRTCISALEMDLAAKSAALKSKDEMLADERKRRERLQAQIYELASLLKANGIAFQFDTSSWLAGTATSPRRAAGADEQRPHGMAKLTLVDKPGPTGDTGPAG